MRRHTLISSAPAILIATACLAAATWQCRVAYAIHLAGGQVPEQLIRAADLTPEDASAWHRLGVALLKQGSPAAGASLRRAVVLDPADADGWAALGLFAEMHGSASEAESHYRNGANLTRRYRPKLALASYYFRADNSAKFWDAAVQASAVRDAYLGRIFEFAHAMASEPRSVPEKLHLRSEYSLGAYLSFLIETGQSGDVADVSRRLPAIEQHRNRLFSATERLIREGDALGALAVWNRLSTAGFTGTEPLDTVRGPFATNPHLLERPARGFNWRSANLSGAALAFRSGGGLRLEFAGEQADSGNVLSQWIAVEPGRDYQLRVRYETNNIQQATGLRWTVQEPKSTEDLSAGGAVLKPVPEGVAETRFHSPPLAKLLRLTLTYGRVPGTMRIDGDVTLHEVKVESVP